MTDVRVLRVAQWFNGWSNRLAVVADGEREVLKLVGWTGGTGNTPPIDLYLGVDGYVTDIADGVDIRGAQGTAGTDGTNGTDGASAYVYIAYADDSSGTGFTLTFNSTKHYIAIKTTTSPIVSPIASDFTGLWVIYSGNPDLSAYLTIADSRFILETITGTTYTLSANKVTSNGRYVLEFSDNSFTSLTLPTPTSLGVTTNDSVQVRITGTYAAQTLVAGSGATIEGTAAFNAQWHTKTLIAKSATVWSVVG